ncbi:polyprenyl synthetase family protein [Candidatus Nephthysia bennettiae]|uniref:Polyprenyl synthetase family protein n=1 Tax=Candidatus Nephthysia bennettiae TaxID=3127016 RepID=A0A934K7R5_9BACT|nr:polyprenyl synthetase family protein [Candidatus Dormibacteraeota bacterium]MBJ7613156.1 polyprenyl synthetase family protein [Candidatus Dormibacteraeota bacterium]
MERGIERVLEGFLAECRQEAVTIDPRLGNLVDELQATVGSGGKRLRPRLLLWGYRAGGSTVDEPVMRAAASLELLHTFALIQDDVMDQSATRRGRPASHVTLAAEASRDAARFGESAAILLGDLALIWADRLMVESGFSGARLAAGLAVYNALRTEVTLGQYLDVLLAHGDRPTEEGALQVDRYKTATYTVQRPIQLGLALAGAAVEAIDAVPAYAVPAGIAFQLRDDLLGAMGDPGRTGKPSGEDLLSQKPTWLWARTLRLAPQAAEMTDLEVLRRAVVESGAASDAESKIGELAAEALAAARRLPVPSELREELVAMTEQMVVRTS